MSARELVVLGTASQAPTRLRAHNGYVLRWDDQLVLFDPGEGSQRQCILAGVAVARLSAICITHFHGDHSLGLPGVLQRRALDSRSSNRALPPLPVHFPADGQAYFDRLRTSTIFHDTSGTVAVPITGREMVGTIGTSLQLRTEVLDHRVTTIGYRLDEPDGVSLDKAKLAAAGIRGADVGRLVADGVIETGGRWVHLDAVSKRRPGQSMAFIMDTRPCEGALALADGADLVVCESTYLERDAELATTYHHMTAAQAGRLADEAGARRLVLTHFSARYPDSDVFLHEAAAHHDDVVVAEDLAVIAVPPRQR